LEEFLQLNWVETIHPDDRQWVYERWQSFMARATIDRNTTYRLECRHVNSNGGIVWVLAQAVPERDRSGNIISYIGSLTDITDRKKVEEILQCESTQKTEKIQERDALLDIASDAIFARDLEDRIFYWNRGAERLYGWSAAEALGRKANELLQEDLAIHQEIIQIVLERGECQQEIRKVTKTGKEVIVEGRWTLVRDESGQPKSILSVNTDITEKKQLETQFYHAQRLESIGTLASGIAHDLNNILTPILGLSQVMSLKYPNLEAGCREMLQVIENNARRGAKLVKQILTFTRGAEGETVALQFTTLLREIVSVIGQTFPKSIEIKSNIPHLRPIAADPTYLNQVLMNLVVNARDAMPDGGILTISATNYSVDPLYARMNPDVRVGKYVLVTIADTGMGMSPKVLDRIFEPFFTTKESGRGTGLGLSTVLGIVKSYGGFVRVFSQVGRGSEFQVFLPALNKTARDMRLQTEELLEGNGELVSIVDDDLEVLKTTQSMLEQYGYKTLAASNGVEAIDVYARRKQEIEVVLIDMMMPNLSGINTIRTLKVLNPEVKIIAVSGLSERKEEAFAAGARVFLPKPYTIETLLRTLRSIVDRSLPVN
jgi:PAS domain S-box-containing protein